MDAVSWTLSVGAGFLMDVSAGVVGTCQERRRREQSGGGWRWLWGEGWRGRKCRGGVLDLHNLLANRLQLLWGWGTRSQRTAERGAAGGGVGALTSSSILAIRCSGVASAHSPRGVSRTRPGRVLEQAAGREEGGLAAAVAPRCDGRVEGLERRRLVHPSLPRGKGEQRRGRAERGGLRGRGLRWRGGQRRGMSGPLLPEGDARGCEREMADTPGSR